MHPIVLVLFILIAALVAVIIIDKTMPGEYNMIAKLIVGVLCLIAIIILILPMAGVHG